MTRSRTRPPHSSGGERVNIIYYSDLWIMFFHISKFHFAKRRFWSHPFRKPYRPNFSAKILYDSYPLHLNPDYKDFTDVSLRGGLRSTLVPLDFSGTRGCRPYLAPFCPAVTGLSRSGPTGCHWLLWLSIAILTDHASCRKNLRLAIRRLRACRLSPFVSSTLSTGRIRFEVCCSFWKWSMKVILNA